MVPILVVDPDKQRLSDTASVLSRHGYCPLTARFGGDALALLSQLPVGVALVDWAPSNHDHEALIGAIRRRHPGVAVVAMLGSDHAHTTARLAALGVSRSVRHPSPAASLLTAVGSCLVETLAAA